ERWKSSARTTSSPRNSTSKSAARKCARSLFARCSAIRGRGHGRGCFLAAKSSFKEKILDLCRRLDRLVGLPTIALCSLDLSALSSFYHWLSHSQFLARLTARSRLAPRASTSRPLTQSA